MNIPSEGSLSNIYSSSLQGNVSPPNTVEASHHSSVGSGARQHHSSKPHKLQTQYPRNDGKSHAPQAASLLHPDFQFVGHVPDEVAIAADYVKKASRFFLGNFNRIRIKYSPLSENTRGFEGGESVLIRNQKLVEMTIESRSFKKRLVKGLPAWIKIISHEVWHAFEDLKACAAELPTTEPEEDHAAIYSPPDDSNRYLNFKRDILAALPDDEALKKEVLKAYYGEVKYHMKEDGDRSPHPQEETWLEQLKLECRFPDSPFWKKNGGGSSTASFHAEKEALIRAGISSSSSIRQVLNAAFELDLDAIEHLFNAIDRGSLPHVVWGSSLGYFLSEAAFDLLAQMQQRGFRLQPHLMLLKATAEDEDDNLGYGGVLINKNNLKELLTNDPEALSECEFTKGMRGYDQILAHLEKQQCSEDMLYDQRFLEILKGNAPSNAVNRALLGADPETVSKEEKARLREALKNSTMKSDLVKIFRKMPSDPNTLNRVEYILQHSDERIALKNVLNYLEYREETEPEICRFEGFQAWDSPETNRLCLRALKESIAIHKAHFLAAEYADNYMREVCFIMAEGIFV